MYSVMIVDDERPSRELLKLLVDWEETGFFICCEASDGQDALNKYHIYRPDLVITDIQMPVMDGLSLIRRVRNENPEQLFVVLSCHEQFDYARSAIKLGVHDYLIKDSLLPKELLGIFEQVKKKLPKELPSIFDRFSNISEYSPRIRRIVEHILRNYEKDISLRLIAEHFAIHKTYLARIFKEETGVNVHEVILCLRVEKAKQLLLGSESKVSDIIDKVGFHNPQNFYTAFKKYTGLSPSEYRMQNQ